MKEKEIQHIRKTYLLPGMIRRQTAFIAGMEPYPDVSDPVERSGQ